MHNKRLHLYNLNMKYVRDLSKVDDKVMSVSPQENKENRPFVGIVVIMGTKKYCIPLTSPKPKHEKMKNDLDFYKMYDAHNNFIGALNFNNMIPVSEKLITEINIKPSKNDSPKDKIYKELLNNQLDWCNENIENIVKKANKLYRFITITPEKSRNLTRRCCDFKKLEAVLRKWVEKEVDKLNEVLAENPELKAKLNAATIEYNKSNGLNTLSTTSSIEEKYERRMEILKENPDLMNEYKSAEEKHNQKQTPPKPKHTH